MTPSTLFITDIFQSIQGEGPKLGTPSIFLRLGMCNLQCTWCDTPYTWKEGQTDYKEKSFSEIIQEITTLCKEKKITNLVITGGEPLLQQKNIAKLLADPALANMEIEFETNGSQTLCNEIKELKQSISFNISPKLADSGNKEYQLHFYPHSVLKFVYVKKESEALIDKFLEKYKEEVADIPVLIMPEGTTIDEMSKKHTKVLSYCLKKGFRFTPRLHIYLFGNKRAT